MVKRAAILYIRGVSRARRIGIGLAVGTILAAVGTTDILREVWLELVTPPSRAAPNPAALFSAHLVQTFLLVLLMFRAYRFENYGIAAAVWVLATWEAIASIVRRDLLLAKQLDPWLYDITAFLHVVTAAALFLVLGARTLRDAERVQRERSYSAQERPLGTADRSSSSTSE